MTKFALTGVLLCFCGLLIMGYQSLTGLMAMKTSGKTIIISDITGQGAAQWVETLSDGFVYDAATYFINMPFSYIFFFAGAFFLVLSCFQK